MAFWKNALATLGIVTTLLGSPKAANSEPIEKPKIEQKLEEKLKKELEKPVNLHSEGIPSWTILDADAGFKSSVFLKLPNKFSFSKKGKLKGRGFEWDVSKDDFTYNDIPILGYFKSLDNINETYMQDIMIGSMNLEDFINLFNSEKDIIADALLENSYDFKENLLDIYKDQYSEEFMYGLVTSLISGNLDSYLDKNGVSDEQKEKTKEALDDFLDDMDYVLSGTDLDDIIKDIFDADPFDSIYLKGKSLRCLLNIAEAFGELMKVKTTDESLTARMKLEGKGQAKADLNFSYKVKLGDKVNNFTHVLSSEYRGFGHASFRMKLNTDEGAKLSEFFGINPILIYLYGLEDLDIHLKNLNLEGYLKIRSEIFQRLSEGFELSEESEFGKKGFGMINEKREIYQEKGDINLGGRLDTKAMSLDWHYKEIWKSMMEKRDRNLFYVFAQENRDLLWYLVSGGIEISDEEYDWKIRRVMDGSARFSGDKKSKDLNFHPRLNFAVGMNGKMFNPFVSLRTFPETSFKLGTMISSRYFSSKFSLEQAVMDEHNKRILIRPFKPARVISLESFSVPFDEKAKAKIESYFIESEQMEASPLPGKASAQDKIFRKLLSDIKGPVFNFNYSGSELLARAIYCADSSFFVGGGYFTDFMEGLHGVDLAIGYEDLLLKARYGYANNNSHFSHLGSFSIGGSIHDLFIINLDLRAMLLKETEARYEGVEYEKNDVQATLNFIGHF